MAAESSDVVVYRPGAGDYFDKLLDSRRDLPICGLAAYLVRWPARTTSSFGRGAYRLSPPIFGVLPGLSLSATWLLIPYPSPP